MGVLGGRPKGKKWKMKVCVTAFLGLGGFGGDGEEGCKWFD